MNTDLIDRYVHEVGQHLPRRMRADVQMELRSSLQDAVQDLEDEESIIAILQAYGPPEEVAARYQPERYLIGPNLYPSFIVSVIIALGFVTTIFALGIAILWSSEIVLENFGRWFVDIGLQYGKYVLLNVGLMTAIFAALERMGVGKSPGKQTWDPRTLPTVTDPDRINRNEMVFGLVFTVVAILVFNFFPQWIGFIGRDDGIWQLFPILAPEFRVHVPWLTALWGLEIVIKLAVLRHGRWQRSTRWAELGLSAAGLYVIYRMIAGGPITIIPFFTIVAKGILGLVLLIALVETFGMAYRLITERPFTPWLTMKSRASR
jgi:hypothetical protein